MVSSFWILGLDFGDSATLLSYDSALYRRLWGSGIRPGYPISIVAFLDGKRLDVRHTP